MGLRPFHFLLLHFLFVTVHSGGLVIKTGVVKSKGEAHNENEEDVKFQKGLANYEGEEGFNKDQEQKHVLSQDFGNFGEHLNNKKSHVGQNNFQNENFHHNIGDNIGNVDKKIAHHKGHHRTGFTNSYHKDETGSNSSFFDDGSDQGDVIESKNYRASHGDAGRHNQGGGAYDSSDFANNHGRKGVYDNAGRYDKDYGNKRNFNRNNYFDSKEAQARRALGNAYEGGHRFAEDEYIRPPVYYPPPLPYRPPHTIPQIPQKHHITVYEDPRFVDSDLRYRRSGGYADDYVELDVRNPVERTQGVKYYKEPDYLYYD